MPRRVDCRVCGGRRLFRFLDLGSTPLANRFLREAQRDEDEPSFPLDVYLCQDCTQVQLGEVVPPEILFRDYIYVTGTSATMPVHFGAMASHIAARFLQDKGSVKELTDEQYAASSGVSPDSDAHPPSLAATLNKKSPLVVEAGSNDGTLLSAFLGEGARVLGIEPATNIAKLARARGVDTMNEFFTEASATAARQSHGPAEIVVGCNVFAHVDDLTDFVRGVKQLLSPSGVFVVEAPYLFDLLEKLEFDTIYHEHLSYFSVTALAHLFNRHGLSLFDVEYYPIHGGSIRCYVQHQNGPHAEGSLSRYLKEEESRGVRSEAMYTEFATKVEALRESLVSMLRSLRAQGHSIAGYGSPAKGNTLLNYMKIDGALLDFLVDKNPMKHGLLSPGMKLPVLPSEELLARRPDYTLILAWNFADEIIAQQREYLERGGRFIVPIPAPRVISSPSL